MYKLVCAQYEPKVKDDVVVTSGTLIFLTGIVKLNSHLVKERRQGYVLVCISVETVQECISLHLHFYCLSTHMLNVCQLDTARS